MASCWRKNDMRRCIRQQWRVSRWGASPQKDTKPVRCEAVLPPQSTVGLHWSCARVTNALFATAVGGSKRFEGLGGGLPTDRRAFVADGIKATIIQIAPELPHGLLQLPRFTHVFSGDEPAAGMSGGKGARTWRYRLPPPVAPCTSRRRHSHPIRHPPSLFGAVRAPASDPTPLKGRPPTRPQQTTLQDALMPPNRRGALPLPSMTYARPPPPSTRNVPGPCAPQPKRTVASNAGSAVPLGNAGASIRQQPGPQPARQRGAVGQLQSSTTTLTASTATTTAVRRALSPSCTVMLC